MLHTKKNFLKSALAVFCMVSMLLFSSYSGITTVYAASGYEYVLLTKYSKTMKIGDEYYLTAITSTGKKPKFSSSDSTVASVNTYGKITAKKAGNAMITAKIANGEASCRVTVEKTVITLSQKSISLENGYTARLKAETSTGHPVTYKSARSSIASVDENGVITNERHVIGWIKRDGKWYYYNDDETPYTGWLTLDHKTYYLGADGVMATGWLLLDGDYYYFSGSGEMQTGWQFISNNWYYLAKDTGIMYSS